MRSSAVLLILALRSIVHSQLVVAPLREGEGFRVDPVDAEQKPMDRVGGPGPALPPPKAPSAEAPSSPAPGSVVLSDVMGRDRSINIFAGFTRDIESVSRRLDDAAQNTTVLAPLNSAIEKLPRKPWEDPRDYGALGANAYEGDDGSERAQKNLRRFVEAQYVYPPYPMFKVHCGGPY